MPASNNFTLTVDFKKPTYINEPTVMQNDEVVFDLFVFDNGLPADLSDITTFTLASRRADKQSVLTNGTLIADNHVRFALGSTEIAVPGRVDASVQLYDAEGRVSTIPFTYKVLADLATGYIPSEDEQTLIELVLGEGPVILANAEQATLDANTATTNANTAADSANLAATSANDAAALANTAASDADNSAGLADTATLNANNAADAASLAASNANTATTNANDSASAADLATTNANTAAANAQTIADNFVRVGEYNGSTTYEIGNEVGYNGSSYVAIAQTIGNVPTNTTFWEVRAMRGTDGTGAVSTVNSISPDVNGDVQLTPADIGASPTGHTHTIADVTGLQTELDGRATDAELAALQNEVTTHKADGTAHGIGDKATLLTTDKTSVVNAINEVFQSGNNVKSDMVAALLALDPTLPITTSSSWEEIEAATGQISTGKKWASGTSTSNASNGLVSVTGLDFTPSTIIVKRSGVDTTASIFSTIFTPNGTQMVRISGTGATWQGISSNGGYASYGEFSIQMSANGVPCEWIVYE